MLHFQSMQKWKMKYTRIPLIPLVIWNERNLNELFKKHIIFSSIAFLYIFQIFDMAIHCFWKAQFWEFLIPQLAPLSSGTPSVKPWVSQLPFMHMESRAGRGAGWPSPRDFPWLLIYNLSSSQEPRLLPMLHHPASAPPQLWWGLTGRSLLRPCRNGHRPLLSSL